MPSIVDLRRAEDRRDVIHQVVQHLAEGGVVGLPTETSYVAAVQAVNSTAVARLVQATAEANGRLRLGLKSAAEALDYVPDVSELGRKLMRRCWPGPVCLLAPSLLDQGLARALPESTRHALTAGGLVSLRVTAHEFVSHVLRLSPAPLVLGPELGPSGEPPATAQALVDGWGALVDLVLDDGPTRYQQPTTEVRVDDGGGWQVTREGVVSPRMLQRLAGEVYLFVCTGNTCRSPMAEALFRKQLAERLACQDEDLMDRGYVIVSAGLAATLGSPASPEAVELLKSRGIDLAQHESQPLTARLLQQADRVYTMTRQHRDAILREFPEMALRVRVLARDGSDISDPIGFGMDEYERCANDIARHVQGLVGELPVR